MKFSKYIFITLMLAGILSPLANINAQTGSLGTCRFASDGRTNPPDRRNTKPECDALNATWTADYAFLEPLPCPDSAANCFRNPATGQWELRTFDPATNEDGVNTALGIYLNLLIKIILGLAGVLAVVMIVMGGIEYMTSELVSSKEAGKERIRNALLGLILALGAYAILFTINPDLLKSDVKIDPATVMVEIRNDSARQPLVNGKYGNYDADANWVAIAGPATALPVWVTVKPPECAKVGDDCTSIMGLDLSTLRSIHAKCSACELIITGGTESWMHGGATGNTNHKPGGTTVDLRKTATLTTYIMGAVSPTIDTWYQKDGIWYYYEGDHWHVSGSTKN